LLDDALCVEHDALGGVNEYADAIGQPHGRRHLVGEVNVARGVEHVHDEGLVPDVLAHQGHGHRLDGHAALLLREQGVRVPHRLVVLENRKIPVINQGSGRNSYPDPSSSERDGPAVVTLKLEPTNKTR
jgi:hypothetical protein